MLLDNYRREIEQVGPSKEHMTTLLELIDTKEDIPVKKTIPRTTLIAAVLCGILTLTALAASPTLRDTLEALLGTFAPYSQTIEGASVTEQGIQISVLKSLADESGGVIYLEIRDLTGDRLTPDTQFLKTSPLVTPIDYDPETHTLLAKTGWTLGYDIWDEDGNASISIPEIWGGEYFQDIPLPAELLAPDNVLETMLAPEDQTHGTVDDRIVLVPEQTPMVLENVEWFTLSSMGFDELGRPHVQIKLAEGWEEQLPDYAFYADLVNLHTLLGGTDAYKLLSLQGLEYRLENSRYLDFCLQPIIGFDRNEYVYLPKEAYQELGITLQLSGWIGTREKVEGGWTLHFPIDILPNRTLTVNQEVNTKLVESATLSARSITLHLTPTNGIRGDLSLLPVTVYLSDGTHVTVPRGQCTHEHSDAEPYYLNTWKFPDPIDPAEITAFSIAYWYIPLEGDRAGEGHWLTELP